MALTLGDIYEDGSYVYTDNRLLPIAAKYGYWVATGPVTKKLLGTGDLVGVWTSPEGETMLERTTHLVDRDAAIAFGKAFAQYSIWDCAANEQIVLEY